MQESREASEQRGKGTREARGAEARRSERQARGEARGAESQGEKRGKGS
jgi:hypothetical protein